jgi:RNA polymerase sigma factor FliA
MTDDLQAAVLRYLDAPTPVHREGVVRAATPMVRSLLGRLSAPDHPLATPHDLEGAALLGLLQALDSYDPEKALFITHAWRRVQGALVDYLRQIDVLSRGRRQQLAEAQEAQETLRQMLGGEPQDQDVADYLGVSIAEYHDLLVDAQRRFTLSVDRPFGDDDDAQTLLEVLPDDDAEEGFEAVERRSALAAVERMLPHLPERDQTILGLYYIENLTLKEIGQVLGISDARVSQLMGRTLMRLRGALEAVRPGPALRAA